MEAFRTLFDWGGRLPTNLGSTTTFSETAEGNDEAADVRREDPGDWSNRAQFAGPPKVRFAALRLWHPVAPNGMEFGRRLCRGVCFDRPTTNAKADPIIRTEQGLC